MSDPYLILHKVRGEPAFDVAVRLEAEEEIWIIPTSGHRAYPFDKWDLGWFSTEHYDSDQHPHYSIESCTSKEGWADLPDHYQVSEAPRKSSVRQGAVNSLLAAIGRGSKPIQRRKLGE